MPKPNITAVIIAKNEENLIANCVETLRWCEHILVIDNGSSDATADIAEKLGVQVITFISDSFAKLRNKALKYVKTDWLFYVDADERVTPALSKEIGVHVETNSAAALEIVRENVMYGHELNYGGAANDVVTRVFQRQALKEWYGQVHESAEYEGETRRLHTPMLHLTHRNLRSGLIKSAQWTWIEAQLLAKDDNLSSVKFFTLVRKGTMEFLRKAFFKKGYKDGMPGMIEALVQAMNRVFVYIQVWELQQQPPIESRYEKIEKEIAAKWAESE